VTAKDVPFGWFYHILANNNTPQARRCSFPLPCISWPLTSAPRSRTIYEPSRLIDHAMKTTRTACAPRELWRLFPLVLCHVLLQKEDGLGDVLEWLLYALPMLRRGS
jgi:hypothetical protein